MSEGYLQRKRHSMKRLALVVVAAIATAVAPIAMASASSHKTKTVSLSGGQSASVTCSGKSLSVTKSGNKAVLVCASRTVKAPVTAPPVAPKQSPFLSGNAHPQFPAGPAGQVSVVYQAPISPQQGGGTSVPIVLDNNSSKAVAHVNISATAKDATGKIVGSGSSQGTAPSVIQPGEWTLAYIFFGSAPDLSSSDTLSFTVNTTPADTSPYNTAAIQVTQANLSGSAITGGVQNTTGHEVTGPIAVDVYCFDGAGHPFDTQREFTAGSGDLAPNATDSFEITFYNQQCPSYLVGASGYYK